MFTTLALLALLALLLPLAVCYDESDDTPRLDEWKHDDERAA